MAFMKSQMGAAAAAVFFVAIGNSPSGAQPQRAPARPLFVHSPMSGMSATLWRAGLWDKPNQACIEKCSIFVNKSCFKELSEKDPTANPASLQEKCDDKFSVCLYDCMCDTCDENQIIIKTP
jgi:hypothetical protein